MRSEFFSHKESAKKIAMLFIEEQEKEGYKVELAEVSSAYLVASDSGVCIAQFRFQQ